MYMFLTLRFWRLGSFTARQRTPVPARVRHLRLVLHHVRPRRDSRPAQPDAAQVHDHEHRGREQG